MAYISAFSFREAECNFGIIRIVYKTEKERYCIHMDYNYNELDELVIKLQEALAISNRINDLNESINANNKRIAELQKVKPSSTYAILAVIISIIVISSVALPLALQDLSIVTSIMVGVAMVVFVFAVLADDKKTKLMKEQAAANAREIEEQNVKIRFNMNKIYSENFEKINFVPKQYFYPVALNYFIEVIQNRRATSLSMAMNLFEEQLHRWKIENMTEATMVASQRAAADLASVKVSSAITAAATTYSALKK